MCALHMHVQDYGQMKNVALTCLVDKFTKNNNNNYTHITIKSQNKP